MSVENCRKDCIAVILGEDPEKVAARAIEKGCPGPQISEYIAGTALSAGMDVSYSCGLKISANADTETISPFDGTELVIGRQLTQEEIEERF